MYAFRLIRLLPGSFHISRTDLCLGIASGTLLFLQFNNGGEA
jgi:hypothetical protein